MRGSTWAILGEEEQLSLQLGAGVLLEDFDPEACAGAGAMRAAIRAAMTRPEQRLGATREGACLRVMPRLSEHREDGRRCAMVGDSGLSRVEVTLSGTLQEVTHRNLFRLSCFGRVARVRGGIRVDMPLAAPPVTLRNLCWAGDLSGGGLLVIQLVFVALDNQDRPAAVPPFIPETEEENGHA